MASSSYEALIEKLDRFIRKYYMNQIVKGSLLWLGVVLVLWLSFSVLEYQFWFGPSVRKMLFYSFIFVVLGSFFWWIAIPVLRYFKLGKVISHDQASAIIGNHFTEVKDKLLNILQLHKQGQQTNDNALILASVDQKSAEIHPVPFQRAIDLGKNKKYLRFVLPPLALGVGILMLWPYVLTESTSRLIQNNKQFEKPAPFRFALENEQLEVIQYNDFPLAVSIEGERLPAQAYIEIDGYSYRLRKEADGLYHFNVKQVKEDTRFRFYSGTVSSRMYDLKVIEKPQLTGILLDIDYPSYTGMKDQTLENIGDITAPIGTKVSWIFNAKGVEKVECSFGEKQEEEVMAERSGEEEFSLTRQVMQDELYKVYISSRQLKRADSAQYYIRTIADRYPVIQASQFIDSLNKDRIFFAGEAADDYGLQNIQFHYTLTRNGEKESKSSIISFSGNPAKFTHEFELSTLGLQPGDELQYYFEAYDNDAVQGSKASRTAVMSFRKPTLEEYEEKEEKQQKDIESKIKDHIKEQKKVQERIKSLYEKLLNQKDMDWQDREELERILEQENRLKDMMEKIRDKFEEKKQTEEEFAEKSQEQKEKEEKMEELMKELAEDKEKQELLQKIQELMQDMKRDDALDMLEQQQQENKQEELNMERLENMLKQLEFEKDVQDQLDKLNELAKEEQKLREETKKGESTPDKLKQKQEEIREQVNEIEKKTEELQKKSKEVPSPQDMQPMKEALEDIQRDMKEAEQKLEQGDTKGAQKKQKDAQEKMEQLQEDMKSSMNSSAKQQLQEDLETMRQLLEQLVIISYGQEEVMEKIRRTEALTPRFAELTQQQFKLEKDFTVVEDSLIAMSKRNMQIQSFILEKVNDINENFESTVDHLEERQKPEANRYQQQAMTNVNDLALMLSEAMQNMQQQMASMSKGSQMCNKPKPSNSPGKPGESMPMNKISKGQKKLNEQMKKMAKENQKKQQQGKEGMSSEDFARLAQEQAKLRKMMQDLQGEKREQGQGDKELQDIINQMNQTETDLVNKRLTNEMIKRQQDIITRLLESERAERQRKQKEERKAEQAKEYAREQRPPALEQYLRDRSSAIEQVRKVSPSLSPYYKNMVERYYERLGNGK